VTYRKPETIPNQSLTSVQKILQQALAAVQQQDWMSVANYLKLLPQAKSQKQDQEFILARKDWQTAFELAILLLIQADFQHKWAVTKLLPLFGENIIPTLITLVKDPTTEEDVRWFSCQILGNFSNATVIFTLVELLDSTTDQELLTIAGKTLTKIGNDAIDALEELLTKPQHRLLAVQSLFYIRTTQTIEPLLKVALDLDSEPQLKAIALKALGSFHDARIPPVLINALQDRASIVRQEAAIALGFRPDLCEQLDLVEHLYPLLFDLNFQVCRQAAISLGRMKHQKATDALSAVLQIDTTPINLQLDLVKALGWSQTSSAIDYLEQALATSSAVVTAEIITILGRTILAELKPQATQVLVNFWQNKNQQQLELPQIRQTLATSLGELGCGWSKITLEQLAQDGDRKVQLYALAALNKISAH
jgi:HEAT repeat protein